MSTIRGIIILILCGFSFTASAHWRCSAYDGTGQFWDVKAPTRLDAIYKARERCEDRSNRPGRCTVPSRSCYKSAPSKRCLVRDRLNRHWKATGRRACRKALRHCRRWHRHRDIQGFSCWVKRVWRH